ncbi:MAG: addiction module protein [Burkholderiales bacterium]
MSTSFKELEKKARALTSREKTTLARILIEDLDSSTDENVEQLWIEEAQRRYRAYKVGELIPRSGDEVMRKARQRLGYWKERVKR